MEGRHSCRTSRVSKTLVGVALAALSLVPTAFLGQVDVITAKDAANHVGERTTVCGVVASTKFADQSRGQPTFLNLDRPYPDHIFTAVIWGEDRAAFDQPPERAYDARKICVSGEIRAYDGRPQIFVDDPAEITIVTRWPVVSAAEGNPDAADRFYDASEQQVSRVFSSITDSAAPVPSLIPESLVSLDRTGPSLPRLRHATSNYGVPV